MVNSDLQLETEPETPWKTKSQVAILDGWEAIRVALIFIEYAPENEIDDYFSWWHRLVRSRPNKTDQLKLHWENTSWRIALALRKKTPFKDIASEIMAFFANGSVPYWFVREFSSQRAYIYMN